jgi:dipeptidase E
MKQIIAMGGGGFSSETGNLLLDQYFIRAIGIKNPKVCFIPTASGDSDAYARQFFESYLEIGARPSLFAFYHPPTKDLEDFILDKDAVYVGGGNTKNMLAIWRDWGMDKVLQKAYDAEKLLGGLSAGSICWFDQGLTDSIPGDLTALECLGFLKGSFSPHYSGEEKRKPFYRKLIKNGSIPGGLAADDGVAMHYIDGILHKTVASMENAYGYALEGKGEKFKEEKIIPEKIELT